MKHRILFPILAVLLFAVASSASTAEACRFQRLGCFRPARPVCRAPVKRVVEDKMVRPAPAIAWYYEDSEEDWDSYGDE